MLVKDHRLWDISGSYLSLFLNTCSLDKIKNRVRASVALVADFQSGDIDVGIISETHLCRQKLDSTVAIEGYTVFNCGVPIINYNQSLIENL